MQNHRHAAAATALAIATGALAPPTLASSLIIDGPPNTGFGSQVTALPNGNVLVRDALFGGTVTIYLYRADGTLVRTMPGVGNEDPVPLGTDAFLLVDPAWNNGAGAVTRVDASTGLVTPVSPANSIVGASPGDRVGSGGVVVLANGDYVVCSPKVKIGGAAAAGAVTRVSAAAPVYGAVSAANSLVGSTANDEVGMYCVTELANGNYVVRSPSWTNGGAARAGAATWCSGTGACVGPVSAANSLVGGTANDVVGRVVALTNGNYVVTSAEWSSGAFQHAGAVTWGNGATGTTGAVSAANSLVGTANDDYVGWYVTALRNGHYVVASGLWNNGGIVDAGAVTWGNGNGGLVGAVTAANSLVGSSSGDNVGSTASFDTNDFMEGDSVIPLANGNYVVNAAFWSNGPIQGVGAVLLANGNGGTVGTISPTRALVGTAAGDNVGNGGVYVLTNGHYVVASPEWRNGAVALAGAVTWANGNGSTVGAVSPSNSLVGTQDTDSVGGLVVPLSNGHYVTATYRWANGAALAAGAVTWGNGSGGTVGTVSPLNSIVGTQTDDAAGNHVAALRNGNYVIVSPGADSNGLTDNGAVTWMSGSGPMSGAVPVARSLVGVRTGNRFGVGRVEVFEDGNFAVFSSTWDSATSSDVGVTTLLAGNSPTKGTPQPWNSEFGTRASFGDDYDFDYDTVNHQLVVGRRSDNRVTVVRQEQIFTGAFD